MEMPIQYAFLFVLISLLTGYIAGFKSRSSRLDELRDENDSLKWQIMTSQQSMQSSSFGTVLVAILLLLFLAWLAIVFLM